MAHSLSAQKRVRQNETSNARNRWRKVQMRTAIKECLEKILHGSNDDAKKGLPVGGPHHRPRGPEGRDPQEPGRPPQEPPERAAQGQGAGDGQGARREEVRASFDLVERPESERPEHVLQYFRAQVGETENSRLENHLIHQAIQRRLRFLRAARFARHRLFNLNGKGVKPRSPCSVEGQARPGRTGR